MPGQKRLAAVLARHIESGRLRAAFERVNRMPDVRRYDRTALARWVAGDSVPSDETFIAKLSEELDDPEILKARREDMRASDREVRDMITRFRGLSADRKREVLPRLVQELFRDDYSVRSNFSMRIELEADLTSECHRLDVTVEWTGHLPAQASVEVVADEETLDLAYRRPGCIFRELVPIDANSFAKATEALPEPCPELSYRTADAGQTRLKAETGTGPGIYQFNNRDAPRAQIRLTASLPYPADLPMYPVMMGAYPVSGRAMITMVTDSQRCGRPHALRFLGQATAWDHPRNFHRSELSVEIGDDDSLLEPNAGVIFFWLPTR